jgi:hypothetical protein
MAAQALFDIANVFLDPVPTFARLKIKTNAWLPLLVSILLSLAVTVWWVNTLDFDWLREHMLAAQPAAEPEIQEAMTNTLTPKFMMWSSVITSVIGNLLIFAVTAIYYLLCGNVIGTSVSYGKWFGFAVWTSVPRLLVVPLSMLQIVTSHGQLAPEDLNMVSLNYLLFHLPMSNPWAGLASNIDLTTFWSVTLGIIGLKAWTGRSTATCLAIAVLPYVIIYALWAAKIAILG